MQLTKALNYMKTIIDNGKKRKSSTINVRKGLKEYLSTLVGEGVISQEDCQILTGVMNRIDPIMKSEMTVDEAFVRSMCGVQDTQYAPLASEKGQVVQPTIVKESGKKTSAPKKKQTRKSKPKTTSSTTTTYTPVERHSNPWDNWPIEPDGSCGRIQEARKKAAYEEYWEHKFRGCDGIPYKCRH